MLWWFTFVIACSLILFGVRLGLRILVQQRSFRHRSTWQPVPQPACTTVIVAGCYTSATIIINY